jgi:hypothetical protein
MVGLVNYTPVMVVIRRHSESHEEMHRKKKTIQWPYESGILFNLEW